MTITMPGRPGQRGNHSLFFMVDKSVRFEIDIQAGPVMAYGVFETVAIELATGRKA